MSVNGFHHAALKVKDFEKTYDFYVNGLGFKEERQWEMEDGNRAVMLDTGNNNYLEIFEGRDFEVNNGAFLHLAFNSQDCSRDLEKARSAGAEVTMEPEAMDILSSPALSVKVAFCTGPDGETIEFFEEK